MIELVFAPPNLVLIAGAIFTIGYLILNQVILRLLILTGTGFYIWYYFVIDDLPLWTAIYTSVTMGLANVIGLFGLYWRASRLAIPRRHRDLYNRFRHVPPGDFAKLMRCARRRTLDAAQIITREGQPVEALYYVISGTITINKRGESFQMPPGLFVGEVSYLTRGMSSATTQLPAGAEVLVWPVDVIRDRARRHPRFKLALEAMISRDLAVKVAFAVAPHKPGWSPDEVSAQLAQA